METLRSQHSAAAHRVPPPPLRALGNCCCRRGTPPQRQKANCCCCCAYGTPVVAFIRAHPGKLQDYMSVLWRSEGHCNKDLPGNGRRYFEQFGLPIMGSGGTGKTAILKVTDALTTFFAGPDTVRKLAPSNAAARLLGGDTLHSTCKLPFGKASLSSKRGRLTRDALQRHRKKWASAVAAYLDELSMVSADQFLQCDVPCKNEGPAGRAACNARVVE